MLFFGSKSVLLKYCPVAVGRTRLASHERDQTPEVQRQVLEFEKFE